MAAGVPPEHIVAAAAQAEAAADLDYLLENMPAALDRALDGLNRVAVIVRSMKDFAHPDHTAMADADLNRGIESTLVIANNEYKYVADVETSLGELPPVRCHAGEINQVVLNIVVNAAHAIGDQVRGTGKKGRITIATFRDGDDAVVRITDSGGGIPESVRDRIFDPFFTTKEIGKGTGQGLSMARSIVVEKHDGRLDFETEAGVGTTFTMRLPIAGKALALDGVAA
jgi:two-component system, NtrC family, sensor kinase